MKLAQDHLTAGFDDFRNGPVALVAKLESLGEPAAEDAGGGYEEEQSADGNCRQRGRGGLSWVTMRQIAAVETVKWTNTVKYPRFSAE
jgi:hypothetical protein